MKVILYSTHCPKCTVLESKLKTKNITYEEINNVDLMISKGFMSVPMLEVDDTVMNFADAIKWINERN